MDPHVQAILDTDDPTPFETLISDLMMSSNEQRSQAESLFNLCKQTDPNTLARKLVHLLEHSPHLEARSMSAILLRNLFQQTDPNTLVQVKNGLLNSVVNEQNKPIIKILGNTISELAADNSWPELMHFMLDLVASEDSRLQESALLIFAQLAQYVGESLVPHIMLLHDVFMNCLRNVGSADVRIAALSAVINFILCLENQIDKDRFRDLLPGMMQCVTEALNNVNEATAQKALVLLIELAGTESSFFEGLLVEVVEGMLQIAEAENLEEGTRHLAIEFVITLAEPMWDLPPLILSRFFEILLRMLLDIEDEAAWHSAENEDEDDGESSNYSFGECLHRLATKLGGNTIVPVAYEQLPAYLTSPRWQERFAGLVVLAQIAKGHSMMMIPNLEQVMTMVLNSIQDLDHPRVRWAAINAFGELSTDLEPHVVLPALARAIRDDLDPRVRLAAIKAIGQSSTDLDQGMLQALARAICDDPNLRVRLAAIKAIGQLSTDLDPGVLRALARAIRDDPDARVRLAAINASSLLYADLAPDVLLALAKAICGDLDLRVRLAAINAAVQLSLDLDPGVQPALDKAICDALAKAICDDLDPSVRLAAIDATGLLSTVLDSNVLPALAKAICDDLYPRVRLAAINATGQLSADLHPDVLQTLANAINKDLNPRVRLAAINVIGQLFADLDPDLPLPGPYHFFVLPALEEAICDFEYLQVQETQNNFNQLLLGLFQNSHQRVRLAAINAAVQLNTDLDPDLSLLFLNYVLPALIKTVRDFENPQVQAHAASAMINISRNYPLDTSPYLRETVRTLLEEHASSRLKVLELQHQDIASDRNQISAIKSLLIKFELELPHETWDSILARLTPNQQAEYLQLIMALYEDPDPLVRVAAINKTVRLFANLPTVLRPDMLPALAKAICDDLDPDVKLAAVNAAVQLPFVLPDLAQAILCDFENLPFKELAASTLINISNMYQPPDTLTPYLLEIVGTLLEIHATSRVAMFHIDAMFQELPHQKVVIDLDQRVVIVEWHETRISTSRDCLIYFKMDLPHGTWESIHSSLPRNHKKEILDLWDSILRSLSRRVRFNT